MGSLFLLCLERDQHVYVGDEGPQLSLEGQISFQEVEMWVGLANGLGGKGGTDELEC